MENHVANSPKCEQMYHKYMYIYLTEAQTQVYLKKYRHIVAIFAMKKKTGIFKNMLYLYNGMLQINKMNKTLLMN